MPVYNAGEFVGKAIDSILAQTMQNWQLIVVDDASTDSTSSILKKYAAADKRITVLTRTECSGSAMCPRVEAVRRADTPYVAPLDADDIIPPDYLSSLWEIMEKTKVDVVYPTMHFIDEDNKISPQKCLVLADKTVYSTPLSGAEAVALTLDGWRMGCNGGIINRHTYLKGVEKMSHYSPKDNRDIFADELHTRFMLSVASGVMRSEVAYGYRVNHQSVTHTVSEGRFSFLNNNLALLRWIEDEYSHSSRQYILAQRQNFHGIFDAYRLLNRYSFSHAVADRVLRKIKTCRRMADKKILRNTVSPRYFHLLFNPILPTRLILRGADKTRRSKRRRASL